MHQSIQLRTKLALFMAGVMTVFTLQMGAQTTNYAITTVGAISLTSQTIVDSYDSRDPAKSTDGFYDPAKRQSNGNIASYASGSVVNIGGAFVYGGIAVNGGVPKGTQNVTGPITTIFYAALPDIGIPSWGDPNTSSTLTRQNYTLATGSASQPARYSFSSVTLKGNTLTFSSPVGGGEGYAEIYLTKDANITNGSQVIIPDNIHVAFYVAGLVSINASAFVNSSRNPDNLSFYGIAPKPGTTPQWSYTSNADFIGTIYGPEVKLKVSGSADFFGAMIVNTLAFTGAPAFHLDEAIFGRDAAPNALSVLRSRATVAKK